MSSDHCVVSHDIICFVHQIVLPSQYVIAMVQVELIEPAVKGTLNVLKACSEVNVKRVVLVSSVAALAMNPSWPKGQVMDESSWSDKEFCRKTKVFKLMAHTYYLRHLKHNKPNVEILSVGEI